MFRHKALYVVLALIVALAVVVGCAGPAPASPTAAPAPTQAPQATQPPAAATQAPAATPATGAQTGKLADKQVIHMNLTQEPPTLDPTMAEDTTSVAVLSMVNHSLLRFKPDLTVEPALAESFEVSADGTTYTFKLRDGIKYSDGVPIKAQDFVYSWKRLLNPTTAAPYNTLLGDVKGAEELMSLQVPTDSAKLPDLEKALGVSAPDDKTFKVQLKGPANYFPTICALWNTVPLRQDVIEKNKEKWTEPATFATTGPFLMKTWEHQSKIVLVPNPNYYGAKPTLQEIDLAMIGDEKAELEAYKAGELDIVNRVPDADIDAVRADPVLSKEAKQIAEMGTYYVGFNVRTAPFNNKKLRQAFSCAIDRKALVDVLSKGTALPAKSFVPPGLAGYDPNVGFDFDVAKAKQLLKEAGYNDGKDLGTVTLMFNSPPVPGHKPRMEFVQDQLKKNLNVDVKLETMEWGAYLEKCKKDTPQMFRMGWNADYPHPQDFLDVVFRSTSVQNYSGWKNADYDKLLDEAAKTTDMKKQEEIYKQAQKILVDDAPVIFVYFYGHIYLAKPWVQGFVATPQDGGVNGIFFMDKVSIAAH